MLLVDYIISQVLVDPLFLWLLFGLALTLFGWILAHLLPVKAKPTVKEFDGGKTIASKPFKGQYFGGGK